MERATHIGKDGWYINGANVAAVFHSGTGEIRMRGKDIDRLAAYEETGLEPEEIISAVDTAKIAYVLHELNAYMARIVCALHELNAYKELGPIDRLRELKQANDEGRCVVLPAKPDQTIYQWRIGDDCPSVSRLDGVQISGDGEITYPIWCGHLIPEDFGKTVFLTREEAAAALRREQDG